MLLDPAVKDGYRIAEIDGAGLDCEDFDSDVLYGIHPVYADASAGCVPGHSQP